MIRKLILLPILFFPAILCLAQYPNVMIGNSYNPTEPSIIINPKNTSQMVAGANIDNYYYSNDAGYSWNAGVLNSPYGVWGDPCIAVDTSGNFYFLHLSTPPPPGYWIDRIVCQKSVDGGQTWSSGSYMGLDGTKAQDKEWAVIDRSTNSIYVTWTQFDSYGSSSPNDSSIIRFSKSADGGQTWSEAKRINIKSGDCRDEDNTVEGAVPALGPNGEIYVSWAGPAGLVFNKSLDGGNTWLDSNTFVSEIPGGWDYAVSGIQRANGLPVTCCDISNGLYRGNIYINWSDQRNGPTDTDVWFVKSTDQGNTWSAPKRVNDDPPGKQQFFTWMTVDQVTGFIWFVFYDRRDYSNNLTDVYLAVSRDGGETFENIRVSETPFYPDPNIFFGDYTNISAHNSIVRPIWTRLNNDSLSIMTAIVDSMFVGIAKKISDSQPFSLEQNFPNPVTSVTSIPFRMQQPAHVSIKVLDVFGKDVGTVVANKWYGKGKYIEYFDASAHSLAPGFYYLSMVSGDLFINRKMIVR